MGFICIKPLDALFFRTGRPFTKKEETWAECMFPPSPSTLYGAIRSFMIFQREGLRAFYEGKYKEDIGAPNIKGSLKIRGPLLYIKGSLKIRELLLFKDEMFFPVPCDLVKEESENELIPLKFLRRPNLFVSDYSLDNVLIYKPIKSVKEWEDWFSEIGLSNYLKNRIELSDYLKNRKDELTIKRDSLFIEEPKIGIAREKETLTTKEGCLYRIPMVRLMDGVSLVAEINGIKDFPDSGVLQLGGEARSASFEKLNKDLFDSLNKLEYNFENGYFKIYIATPAIFEKGYLPMWIDEQTLEGEINGIKLRLICCAIGKPIHIGGWDIAGEKAKPIKKAVPPGSVYYFKILENSCVEKIKETFHLKNISDINPDEGFGLSIVGEVKL